MKKLLSLLFLLLAFCWPHDKAHATACTAGCTQFIESNTFSGTTPTATLTGVTAGHALHIYYCVAGPTAIASVTVGGSSTGVTIGGTTSSGGGRICGLSVKDNTSSGSNAVVVNTTGACTGCEIWVSEWAGEATSSSLNAMHATYTAGSSSTPLPCGSITSSAGDTIDALLFQPQNVAPTIPSGYAVSFNFSTYVFGAFKTSVGAGATNPTYTSGASSFDNSVICGSLAQAGGGPTLPPQRTMTGIGQ